MTQKAVVLAAGRGTRMRQEQAGLALSRAQRALADAGLKALVPLDRPFLDYSLAALAAAGVERVCLVVAPRYEALAAYVAARRGGAPRLELAVQQRPRGTADAVLAARAFVGGDPFLVLNSDNYYPAAVLAPLVRLGEPGLVGFDRERLLAAGLGNLSPDRLAAYALVRRDGRGYLRRIVEKPAADLLAAEPAPVLISFNCWRFSPLIFDACRAIPLSPRGELELPAAVQYAVDHLAGCFRVLVSGGPVLDLSSRADIPAVAAALRTLTGTG